MIWKTVPWILSALLVTAVSAMLFLLDDPNELGAAGSVLGGAASALAFIWLVAAYLIQSKELSLQRHELSLQRQAIELQQEELSRISKYSALAQISHLLEQFDSSVRDNANVPANSVNEMHGVLMTTMQSWKTIMESSNVQAKFDAYTKWQATEIVCHNFLDRLLSAVRIYEEASGVKLIADESSSEKAIYYGYNDFRTIPFVQHYADVARGIAETLMFTEPGRDRVKLAGLQATDELMPNVVRPEAIKELEDKVADWDRQRDS